jgi:hypothetical protein
MSEKSGIELLQELIQKVDILSKKVDVLDQNVKKMINSKRPSEQVKRANAEMVSGVKTEIQKTKTNIDKMRFSFDRASAKENIKPTMTMVRGKMATELDGKEVPLIDISVKIYNDKDQLVKETKTNRAGHWMSQLPPGRYVALFEGEYNGSQLVPQNRNFEVTAGSYEIEVK